MKHTRYFSPRYDAKSRWRQSISAVSHLWWNIESVQPTLILLFCVPALIPRHSSESGLFQFWGRSNRRFQSCSNKNKCFDEKTQEQEAERELSVVRSSCEKATVLLLNPVQVTQPQDLFNSLLFCDPTDALFRGVISLAPDLVVKGIHHQQLLCNYIGI